MYSYNSPAVIGAEQISLPEDVSDPRSSSLRSVVTVQSVFGDDEASQNKIIKQQRCLVNVTKQHPGGNLGFDSRFCPAQTSLFAFNAC